ncbi:hypothetical protein ASPWEDRAFT_170053 [Aspergillus wentii DTO 134E9]|uniref:Uncharacterized protein n=1 Tax=Aspergillus wentii DTO 134E9 TaxID=1073089 RepID=A0A1L9RNL1_ASPWE|nr:uncharacterized protein ASPWEDRAFT_170053 [Aspergillus wentii DTO 134E9]KAI9934321.1 hypothetical protein MW887_005395 [Aspergillus wentii]OJJ36539.1 hypothetical protein ASPWEDRAFT_170053 [Aspergillus wentii DTO 134E9]
MATLGAPGPMVDHHHSLQSMVTTLWRQVNYHRPRTRIAKALSVTVAICLFLILFSSRSSGPTVNYYTKFPSHYPTKERSEDALILSDEAIALNNGTLPSSIQKTTSSFHLVLPARRTSPALCRTVTSAMIMDFPPPTLINYGKKPGRDSTDYDDMAEMVTGVYEYLKNTPHIKDEDLALVADGLDFFFQLPAEVLVKRFQNLLRENNLKLQKKYGFATVENTSDKGGKPEIVQKYMQRVLFGAGKACFPNMERDVGCVTVPQSSLPPDVYGWKTDIHPDGVFLNRPRWLTPGAVIGQVGDLKLIYAEILHSIKQRRNRNGDHLALTQIFGRQEYVRELERQRTSNRAKEWLYSQIGISDATNITDAYTPYLETGRRYEFGIGVDYESRIFFNSESSHWDVEWFRYNNINRTSEIQGQFGIPRERRLLLPTDLEAENLESPFTQRRLAKEEMTNLPYNETLDDLPNSKKTSWHNIRLMTNVHSTTVPAMLHMEDDDYLRDSWWEQMWFYPWARALLRKYMRSPRGLAVAQSALRGGQDWWDMRGGRGGVWTDRGEWIDYGEMCGGYARDIFNDGFGPWGKENGEDDEEPVYNQFGNLVKGHE